MLGFSACQWAQKSRGRHLVMLYYSQLSGFVTVAGLGVGAQFPVRTVEIYDETAKCRGVL